MKSRYLALLPIVLIALFLIPLVLLRNELARKPDVAAGTSPTAAPAPTAPAYGTITPSPDGIGKTFMGREIAKVMGHPGIGWLERTEREKEEAPSRAIAMLGLPPNAVIADIGAGSGYYSFRLAPLVPQGEVIAIDIQQEMLDYLQREASRLQLSNVRPHLGTIEDIQLPAHSLDAVLMVDAYHEFSHPAEMLRSIHSALRTRGRVFLLEFRAEDDRVPIKPLHKMSAQQAIQEFEALGFRFIENKTALPWQHLLIFEKPAR